MRKGTCCNSVVSSFRGGQVGKASGRRLGPSLESTAVPTPHRASTLTTPTPLPNLALCFLPVGIPHRASPLSLAGCPSRGLVPAVRQPRPGREVAGPTGGKSLGRGGAGSVGEGSWLLYCKRVGSRSSSQDVSGAPGRAVAVWDSGLGVLQGSVLTTAGSQS